MPAINKNPQPKDSPATPPVVNRAVLTPRGPAEAIRLASVPPTTPPDKPKEETRHG